MFILLRKAMDKILSMKMESKDVLDERRHQTDIFTWVPEYINIHCNNHWSISSYNMCTRSRSACWKRGNFLKNCYTTRHSAHWIQRISAWGQSARHHGIGGGPTATICQWQLCSKYKWKRYTSLYIYLYFWEYTKCT